MSGHPAAGRADVRRLDEQLGADRRRRHKTLQPVVGEGHCRGRTPAARTACAPPPPPASARASSSCATSPVGHRGHREAAGRPQDRHRQGSPQDDLRRHLRRRGGEEDIRLRGFALNTTGDLFIDGMRDPAFYDRDTFNFDRIEVMRGSASMLFGRSSTGGAVNQVNKQAKLIEQNPGRRDARQATSTAAWWPTSTKTGDDSALRINAMRTQADNNGAGSSLDKYGFAADYRWGIGSRDEFEVSFFTCRTTTASTTACPIRKSATNPALTIIGRPVQLLRHPATTTTASANYATFAHTHRFSADTELVPRSAGRLQTATSAPAPCASPARRSTRRRSPPARTSAAPPCLPAASRTRSRAWRTCSPRATCPPSSRPSASSTRCSPALISRGRRRRPRSPHGGPGRRQHPQQTDHHHRRRRHGLVDEGRPHRSARTASSRAPGGVCPGPDPARPHWKILAGLRYDGMSASTTPSTPTPAPSPTTSRPSTR